MFDLEEILNWLQLPKVDSAFDNAFQCLSRDIFQARLDNLYQETKNPLLVAVAGEVGNNSFDHNLGSWRDIAGVYFRNIEHKTLVIADRGQGVKKTLSRIMPNISSDEEAVEIAFTKIISGRSPEQRGNGLKFVASVVKGNNWNLYFQSGLGLAKISNGEIIFSAASVIVNGCIAVLKY